MPLVIADTSPIRYLIQIGHIDLLGSLFENVAIPSIVAEELRHSSAPQAVQAWMARLPGWLEVLPVTRIDSPSLNALDPGEEAAIMLGLALKAKLILIDDRKGAATAIEKGFETTGTLGILDLAAERGLIDLNDAIDRLKRTNFRYRQALFDVLLERRKRE